MVTICVRYPLVEVCHFPRSRKPVKDLISGKSDDEKIQYLAMEKFKLGLTDYLHQWGGALPQHIVCAVAAQSVSSLLLISARSLSFSSFTTSALYIMTLKSIISCSAKGRRDTSL